MARPVNLLFSSAFSPGLNSDILPVKRHGTLIDLHVCDGFKGKIFPHLLIINVRVLQYRILKFEKHG